MQLAGAGFSKMYVLMICEDDLWLGGPTLAGAG